MRVQHLDQRVYTHHRVKFKV